jgi:glycosyltransferase involved in cell wall biosynthesis
MEVMMVEVITPTADPDRGGFGVRVHGIVSMLGEFADVRVVITESSDGHPVPGVEYVHLPSQDTFRTRIQRMRTYYRLDFPKRNHQEPPDVVFVESLELLGLHQYGPRVPLVLDEHNVYWNLLRYEMTNAPFFRGWIGRRGAVRRLLIPRLLERAKRYEVSAIRRSVRTLVTSETDREAILEECPDAASKLRVLPSCVDVQRISPLPDPGDARSVVFVGDFNYVPNREAAEFIVRTLAPKLPHARFLLVGPNREPGRLAPNVVATGYAPDLSAVFLAAAICIAPLARGSGTRIKILTYLAAARPVVTTSKGCEGLPVEDGRHLLIRDNPRDFIAAVGELLEDPERRRRLGAEGRKLVESKFDWRVQVPYLRELTSEILDGPSKATDRGPVGFGGSCEQGGSGAPV